MISQITGKITFKTDKFIIIEANCIGFKIFGTTALISGVKENETTKIWTYLAVREHALDLYGFSDKKELDFFELLNTISGVGPKTALIF